ncbi:hypothetical protein GCWU000324_01667 [Kingella oralis ATCC 51147]|uniref:Uncharacterized protein n=1 Tax=Kingella oralis ATCC 51147 TaxID=629741 RepID=C4GL11_9NEIS|nr:hypothetical protein GCWU000324_01667 [Kingella oralis ATCC 51147]
MAIFASQRQPEKPPSKLGSKPSPHREPPLPARIFRLPFMLKSRVFHFPQKSFI